MTTTLTDVVPSLGGTVKVSAPSVWYVQVAKFEPLTLNTPLFPQGIDADAGGEEMTNSEPALRPKLERQAAAATARDRWR